MSVGDYGTFVDSLYAEKTELRAVADQTGGINEVRAWAWFTKTNSKSHGITFFGEKIIVFHFLGCKIFFFNTESIGCHD